MLDHMLFHDAYWMQRTNDVKEKLANYDSLKRQVTDLQAFYNNVMSQNGKLYNRETTPNDGTFVDDHGVYFNGFYLSISNNGTISFR